MTRSRWGMIGGCLVVFGISCSLFWVDTRLIRDAPAWLTFEFCQYAEIGKNLAEEGTFDTRLVEPMALAMIDRDAVNRDSKRWPVVNRYPLPCLVVAAFMTFLGPTDQAASWSNGLAISLLATITYAAARTRFGAGWAAVVGLLFLANPSFYGVFVLIGTPDIWFALVFLLELLVWSNFDPTEERTRPGWAVCLGAIGGLAYLSRFNASIFLAIQAAVLLRHRRWREVGLMSLTAGLVVSPMLIYNVIYFQRPLISIYSAWNLLDRIGAYQLEPWLYYRRPDLTREFATHLSGFARKFAENLFITVPSGIWSLWRLEVLMPAALVGVWASPRGTNRRRFARWSVGLFVLQLILFSALRLEFEGRNSPHNGRYFFWFAAPVLLLAVETMARLSSGRRWVQCLVTLAILGQLYLFGAAWVSIVRAQRSGEVRFGRDPVRQMLSQVVADNRVIASNQPQVTAWCCGLRSISLPAEFEELERLNLESPTPVDYILIDMNFNAVQVDSYWIGLLSSNPLSRSPWEKPLLERYEFVFNPDWTRPLSYVLLRRKGVPRSDVERQTAR